MELAGIAMAGASGWRMTEVESAALKDWLGGVAAATEDALDGLLPPENPAMPENPVWACMRYAVFGGGKRMRPALVAGAYGAGTDDALTGGVWRTAAAMEMIHTYSLIQDDLPCMDDDDLRRGRATSHTVYGEATALLASDGLQARAFEILADPATHADAAVRCELVRVLAQAAGDQGMVAGQMVDMALEGTLQTGALGQVGVAELTRLQDLKTGALMRASVRMGALLAGASGHVLDRLDAYAAAVGLGFQIWDDVLDVTADAATLGKTPGKDAQAGKVTFVSLLGLAGAEAAAREQGRLALAALDGLPGQTAPLRQLAMYAVSRAS